MGGNYIFWAMKQAGAVETEQQAVGQQAGQVSGACGRIEQRPSSPEVWRVVPWWGRRMGRDVTWDGRHPRDRLDNQRALQASPSFSLSDPPRPPCPRACCCTYNALLNPEPSAAPPCQATLSAAPSPRCSPPAPPDLTDPTSSPTTGRQPTRRVDAVLSKRCAI